MLGCHLLKDSFEELEEFPTLEKKNVRLGSVPSKESSKNISQKNKPSPPSSNRALLALSVIMVLLAIYLALFKT